MNLNPLRIDGVIKGLVNLSTFYDIGEKSEDFVVGEKVWVMVNSRPDILFMYPQIRRTREEIVELIRMEILLQAETNDEPDPIGVMNHYLEEMKTENLIEYDDYKFLMKEMEIL